MFGEELVKRRKGMDRNPYKVLGLDPAASAETVKRRYRERLREVHPDLNPQDPGARRKTQELIEAYEFLADKAKRKALDERLRAAEAPPRRKPPANGPAEAPRRKKRRARASGSASPRRPEARPRKAASAFQQRVVINGQTVDVSAGGSVNVVVNGSGVHIRSTAQSDGSGEMGDVRVGSGSMSDLVMGDLHIRAGSKVHISGKVMGDVIVAAKSRVTISGKVMGDVHAKGSSLRVLGVVMGDLFVDPGSAEILGVHLGDLR